VSDQTGPGAPAPGLEPESDESILENLKIFLDRAGRHRGIAPHGTVVEDLSALRRDDIEEPRESTEIPYEGLRLDLLPEVRLRVGPKQVLGLLLGTGHDGR